MSRIGRMMEHLRSQGVSQKIPMPEVKKSAVGGLLSGVANTAWIGLGGPRWTTRSYEQLAKEGYRKNVIANRCVRLIAESTASVPWLLYRGDREIPRHPLLDLLKRPNPMQGGTELFETLVAFLNIAGNGYLEAAENINGMPGELYVLRPDRMKVLPGHNGWPQGYEYSVGGQKHVYRMDVERGLSPVLHVKTFNPLDDYYGLSPLEAAAIGIDIHNAAAGWNKALFDNAARPSGALIFEPQDGSGATLSQDQFDRLKVEMETSYQGAINAGRPLLLEGGLRWQQIAFSPSDMEFIEGKNVSAREIALAFGVPPMLLSIPGDNTYSNYQEANRALWRQTILPLLDKLASALNNWLVPKFGEDLRLAYNSDEVPALTADRTAAWARVDAASFLTINEKRAAVGMDPIEGGDKLPGPTGLNGQNGNGAADLNLASKTNGDNREYGNMELGQKYNHRHRLDNGQFDFGGGSGSGLSGAPKDTSKDTPKPGNGGSDAVPSGQGSASGDSNGSTGDTGSSEVNASSQPSTPKIPDYPNHPTTEKDWKAFNEALDKRKDLRETQKRIFQEIFVPEGGMRQASNGTAVAGILDDTLKDAKTDRELAEKLKKVNKPSDLTPDQVIDVYKYHLDKDFSLVGGSKALDNLNDPEAASALADTVFRHGRTEGAKITVDAIYRTDPDMKAKIGVPVSKVDAVGSKTLGAYNELLKDPDNRRQMLQNLRDARIERQSAGGDKDRADHFRFLPKKDPIAPNGNR